MIDTDKLSLYLLCQTFLYYSAPLGHQLESTMTDWDYDVALKYLQENRPDIAWPSEMVGFKPDFLRAELQRIPNPLGGINDVR